MTAYGDEALQQQDAVLMDLQVPVMDGYESVSRMRQILSQRR